MTRAGYFRLLTLTGLSALLGGDWARRHARRGRALLLAAALYSVVGSPAASAQNIQYTKNSTDLQLRGDLKVNPSTRALEFQLSLAGYPGRAGLDLPVTLSYSSKVWRVKYQGYNPGGYSSSGQPLGNGYTMVSAEYAEQTMAGWTSSIGFPVMDFSGGEVYDQLGNPTGSNCGESGCFNVGRLRVRMTDGSTHELRPGDQPYNATNPPPPPDDYYAVDGSRLRYQVSTNTLFLPDGSRYKNLRVPSAGVRYVDRNGNTLTYDGFNRRWTDTLGRAVGDPLAVSAYTAPGLSVPYTLVWKSLGDVGVLTVTQGLRYVANQGCPQSAEQGGTPYLFPSGENNTHICNAGGAGQYFNPTVLHQIVLPTGQSYTFSYNVYGEIDKVVLPTGGYERFEYAQFMGLSSMTYPYAQANRGVTKRHVSATGAPADEKTWTYSGSGGFVSITAPDQTLTERNMHTDSPTSGAFGYSLGGARAGLTYDERHYSAPEGSGARRMLRRKLTEWAVTGSNATGQFPTAQQYANRNPRVVKEVEILLDTGGDALAKITTYGYDLTYEFSTGAYQTSVNEYDYVTVPQSTAQAAPVGSFAPPAQWLRRTEYDYLDATSAAYRGRNLLGLKKETRVKDAAGAVVARTVVGYDQYAVEPSPNIINHDAAYGTGFATRGNPTSVTSYADAVGMTGAVTTATHYDVAGNAVSTTDANGNTSTVSYADSFSDLNNWRNTFAYPTGVTTAAPNPSAVPNPAGGTFAAGTFGSTTGLTSSTVYDFSTGLAAKTTDANGKTTTYDYTDPLNRLKRVELPDGGRTTYTYVAAHQCGPYVETRTLLDTSGREVAARQFFDGLGRPYLSESDEYQEAGTPFLRADTVYDAMGRVSQVSSPYRSGGCTLSPDTSVRTTTEYDALGRVKAVTTPDGAKVYTLYDGARALVTDQAKRQRISQSDALGRLTGVWEVRPPDAATGTEPVSFPIPGSLSPAIPAVSAGYRTAYAYDALGNLRTVSQPLGAQPGQTRTFLYDSLSRLTSATNPEGGTVSYAYDANGNLLSKTDARGVTTTYAYDGLNRNIITSYAGGGTTTPTAYRHYDNPGAGENGLGRFWHDSAGGGSGYVATRVGGYDPAGRVLERRQNFVGGGGDFSVRLAYDLAGNVTSLTYPSGHAVTYNYDAAGRLGDGGAQPAQRAFYGTLGDGVERTYASQVTYGEFGGVREERFGTQTPLYNKRHYNRRGQLFDVRLSTVSWAADRWDWNRGAIANYYSGNYAWEGNPNTPAAADNNGNLLRSEVYVPLDPAGAYHATAIGAFYIAQQTYSYDALNRLESVTEAHNSSPAAPAPSFTQAYKYDRWGNRTISPATTDGLPEPQFSVDPATNRLGVPAGYGGRMDYDAAGNLTNDTYTSFGRDDGTATRIYDAENRLTLVKNGDLQTVSAYTYDADGRRVKRRVGNEEWWQVYGPGGELLAEYRAGAATFLPAKEYGYRGGELLVTMSSGDDLRLRRFVYNLYYGALQRDPTAQELQAKTNELGAAGAQGQAQLLQKAKEVARALFIQTNYETSPYRSDAQYVSDLYYTYLQRAPDDAGLSGWAQYAAGGAANRANACGAIEGSAEFSAVVSTLYGSAASDDERTERFVHRFHLAAHGRGATAAEMQQWRDALNAAAAQGAVAVKAQAEALGRQLFASQVNDLTIPPGQFVTNLYEGFLQRGPDAQGLAHWTAAAGTTAQGRQNVLNAFAVCDPFRELAGTLYREAFWLVTDHLGTPRMVADRTGSLAGVTRHDYLPFGEELLAGTGGRTTGQGYGAADNVRQKFTGYERDNESGLDFAQARYYSSQQGRFTSPDPLLASGRSAMPQSWNRYTYVLNNPLSLTDPTGLSEEGGIRMKHPAQTLVVVREPGTLVIQTKSVGQEERVKYNFEADDENFKEKVVDEMYEVTYTVADSTGREVPNIQHQTFEDNENAPLGKEAVTTINANPKVRAGHDNKETIRIDQTVVIDAGAGRTTSDYTVSVVGSTAQVLPGYQNQVEVPRVMNVPISGETQKPPPPAVPERKKPHEEE